MTVEGRRGFVSFGGLGPGTQAPEHPTSSIDGADSAPVRVLCPRPGFRTFLVPRKGAEGPPALHRSRKRHLLEIQLVDYLTDQAI